jgi:hypothetical protein
MATCFDMYFGHIQASILHENKKYNLNFIL